MTHHRHRALLERLDSGPGVAQRFFVRPGRHRGRYKWFEPEEVPAFEGRNAYVEVDLIAGKWAVLRLVP